MIVITPCPIGTSGSFLRGTTAWMWRYHLPASCVEV